MTGSCLILGVITFFRHLSLPPTMCPLGSLLVYAGIMIEVLVLGQTGHFAMSQPLLCELYVVTAFLTVMAYWKHRGNIVRLLHGEERKTYLSSSKNKK